MFAPLGRELPWAGPTSGCPQKNHSICRHFSDSSQYLPRPCASPGRQVQPRPEATSLDAADQIQDVHPALAGLASLSKRLASEP